jgi:hypothetical protein
VTIDRQHFFRNAMHETRKVTKLTSNELPAGKCRQMAAVSPEVPPRTWK